MGEKRKLGFFFGAGSEIGYGLPSGGRFALDIFKISKDEDKEMFKQQLQNIDLQSQISTKWLPDNFKTKNLYVFGKGNFEEMISSSLENRRESIRDYLDNFDANVTHLLADWDVDRATVERKFVEAAGSELGEKLYSREVVLNRKLTESEPLFESEYFSALLKLFELDPTNELRKVITAILELLLGALGQSLVSHLNDELFEKAPSNMNIFDDLSSIFNMNYAVVGNVGLELVIREQREKVDEQTEPYKLFTELGKTILEQIYCQTLDYQSLIDSHFRYLYRPKSHWAKFTRIAIFLNTVQRYIQDHTQVNQTKLDNGPGFYHDLLAFRSQVDIQAVGTTNYNNLIETVFENNNIYDVDVFHLNGSIQDYYDPYKNRLIQRDDSVDRQNQIVVPFIFTQSGIKPLTSITMSQRYVNLYENYKQCDDIAIIGYGFNGDDGHINGMFRSLMEEENKQIHIFHYAIDQVDPRQLERFYKEKLRIDSGENLHIHVIDQDRQTNGQIWYDVLATKGTEMANVR